MLQVVITYDVVFLEVMIFDPRKYDNATDRFFRSFRTKFDRYGKTGEMPGFYVPRPYDLIVIDAQFLRELNILKPEPVILLALHELHHALHPRSSNEKDAGEWSLAMLRLMRTRGYTSAPFKVTREDKPRRPTSRRNLHPGRK